MLDLKAIAEQLLRDIDEDRKIYPSYLDGMAQGVRKLYERIKEAAAVGGSDPGGQVPSGETSDGEQQTPPGDEASGAPDPGAGG